MASDAIYVGAGGPPSVECGGTRGRVEVKKTTFGGTGTDVLIGTDIQGRTKVEDGTFDPADTVVIETGYKGKCDEDDNTGLNAGDTVCGDVL
jgi:hypothetical protein